MTENVKVIDAERRRIDRMVAARRKLSQELDDRRTDWQHVDVAGAVAASIEECGADVLGFALAHEADCFQWDTRISQSNRDWAAEQRARWEHSPLSDSAFRCGLVANKHHRTILDAAISCFRRLTA